MNRLVVVSNRVGMITGSKSDAGGLAVAMRAALKGHPAVWFGWSGEVVEGEPRGLKTIREGNLTRALVDLKVEDYNRYYKGFANRALWPLFHYRIDFAEFDREDYAGYCRVNEWFAHNLRLLLRPGDLVWVHDYHLIPLGDYLRRLGWRQPIGFFLHTPFPAPDVLTTLPVHDEVIRYLCAYDLVGFQTERDAAAFRDYIIREAEGFETGGGRLFAFECSPRIGAFPISIDTEAVEAAAARSAGSNPCRRLEASLAGRDLVIGVDRLDYTKGLIQRFDAVERLLEEHPGYRTTMVFLQIAPPSRGDVPEYQRIRALLDARAGHINGRFAEFDRQPVRYLNKHFAQETLFGFYRLSAAGLVTPLRDGMNLVAKEYVACQDPDDPGMLVLSRFAGAARELNAALIVNPFDPAAIVDALHKALSMPIEERRERHKELRRAIHENDIHHWRESFLDALAAATSAVGHEADGKPGATDFFRTNVN